jgi:hypothetical protein
MKPNKTNSVKIPKNYQTFKKQEKTVWIEKKVRSIGHCYPE